MIRRSPLGAEMRGEALLLLLSLSLAPTHAFLPAPTLTPTTKHPPPLYLSHRGQVPRHRHTLALSPKHREHHRVHGTPPPPKALQGGGIPALAGVGKRAGGALRLAALLGTLLLPLAPAPAAALSFPLVKATDEWSLWFALLASAALGLRAEKTQIGAALSAPLVTMFVALCLTNLGVLPSSAPIYSAVNRIVVPLAVPMLLFGANIRRVVKDTGRVLIAFWVGAIGTSVAAVLAAALVPMRGVEGGWKIAAALCSRHIGGAINYVAVSDVLQPPAAMITAGIAADNVVVAAYFITIFALANRRNMNVPAGASPESTSAALGGAEAEESQSAMEGVALDEDEVQDEGAGVFTLRGLSSALALSASICWLASRICSGGVLADWNIPVGTVITIIAATVAPKQLQGMQGAAEAAGVLGMQLFFAATGASGSIQDVLRTAPMLFVHSAVQVGLHLAITLGLGYLMFKPLEGRKTGEPYRKSRWWNELLLASNANVGGPTTAAGMASAKGWRTLVVPAILIGVLGYAIATFVSVLLGRLVLVKLMT